MSIRPEHLCDNRLLRSRGFHFFVDPSQIVEQANQLQQMRKAAGITTPPILVWEPKAYSCVPENLSAFVEAMRSVDVFSPNHIELARVMRKEVPQIPDENFFEDLCAPFFASPNDKLIPKGLVVVRAGDRGCFVRSYTARKWLPAYHAPDDNIEAIAWVSKVVDTTGAGNAFLGGLTMALVMRPDDPIFAACAGNVAASFAVEQVGVPKLSSSEDGIELWNDTDVSARFQAYRLRVDHGRI